MIEMNIGIVGNGFVGQATALLDNNDTDLYIYDLDPDKRYPDREVTLETLADKCDVVFICVPTPMDESTGRCHTNIVESVINDLKNHSSSVDIVVRSTVPIGFCRRLEVNFMPEFLTERNWEEDVQTCQDWVIGCYDITNTLFIDEINALLNSAIMDDKIKSEYVNVHFVTCEEAELAKYARNVFLATKVAFFNEVSEFCELKGISYDAVRELTSLDPRIGHSHTQVPGPDGKKGFGGTCFPKDTSSLLHQFESVGVDSYIVKSALDRNVQKDRPEMDWSTDKGRAVI